MTNVHLENKRVSRQFFVIIWIEYALIYMTKNCFNAAMASIVYEGVLTKSQTGLISAVFYMVYGPLQIVGGIIADRYNPENLIKLGLISSGVLNVILFFFHDYVTMLVLWAANGFAQFAIWPAIFKIISSQLAPADRKGAVYYITFASIGGLLLSYLTAAVIPRWEYNFLVSGMVLLVLAFFWVAECHSVDRFMVVDQPLQISRDQIPANHISTSAILGKSGFYILVLFYFFRTVVDQSIKAFSPTMFTELYEGVQPSYANLLNMLIIGFTMLGSIFIRKLYPRVIRNEVIGMLVLSALTLPFCLLLNFIGIIDLSISVIGICIVACLLNGIAIMNSFQNMSYSRFEKSATAAGIINGAASIGIVVTSYGVALVSDQFGWKAVMALWLSLMVLCVLLVAVVIPIWKRFTDQYLKG